MLPRTPRSTRTYPRLHSTTRIRSGGQSLVAAIQCYIAVPSQIARAFAEIASSLGPVDILVNNAGGHRAGPFLKLADSDWLDDYNIKVMGAGRCLRPEIGGAWWRERGCQTG